MNRVATIDFTFPTLEVTETLSLLIAGGWSVVADNKIIYLDNENFDWKILPLENSAMLFEILESSRSCTTGVVLYNERLQSGGQFFFSTHDDLLSVDISVNTLTNDIGCPDFNLYLTELKMLYQRCTRITFNEHKPE